MSKRKNRYSKPRKSPLIPVLVTIAVLLLVVLLCMIGYIGNENGRDQQAEPSVGTESTGGGLSSEPTDQSMSVTDVPADTQATEADATQPDQTEASEPASTEATEPTEEWIPPIVQPSEPDDGIPVTLEDGKLEITSLFQYTGINPDCYWENGEDIAGIVLTNRSGEHLVSARLEMELSDGTQYEFYIEELPAGKTVWAFDVNNSSLAASVICESVECTAEFTADTSLMSDSLSVEAVGMVVTLTNISGETLSDLEITCHAVLDDAYFGGITYTYSAEDIAPGTSADVYALDCFLDTAEVVKITSGE